MTALSPIGLIQKHGLRVFTTADFITLSGLAAAAATHALSRLAAQGLIARIKRGVWASRLAADLNAYEAVAYLRAPWPAYISLYSALADYGIVEEIPHVVYGVSPAPPKRYQTAIGDFSIHHLPARLIWGYRVARPGKTSYLLAEPEKAFLDTVYLALIPRSVIGFPHKRGRRWKLDRNKLRRYAKRFRFPPLERWLRYNVQILNKP
ncbi:MAG: type IV toxin-antitoxin system AbiEi family antitoxin domain-containing protein [Elusimicrobia bacterium]|nr:type IV toxin-antitoxin system AbiEi family antitoxin domain-containing protein [Elusimicrobiota bacterium]